MRQEIIQLCELLEGSSKSFEEGCLLIGINPADISDEEHAYIRDEIFNCEQCGWWWEIADLSEKSDGEQLCESCGME